MLFAGRLDRDRLRGWFRGLGGFTGFGIVSRSSLRSRKASSRVELDRVVPEPVTSSVNWASGNSDLLYRGVFRSVAFTFD